MRKNLEDNLNMPDMVDKIYTEADIRIFRPWPLTLRHYPAAVAVEFSNPVPVYNEDGDWIGNAVLSCTAGNLTGELAIDYACEARLLIETKSVDVYVKVVDEVSNLSEYPGYVVNHLLLTIDKQPDVQPLRG